MQEGEIRQAADANRYPADRASEALRPATDATGCGRTGVEPGRRGCDDAGPRLARQQYRLARTRGLDAGSDHLGLWSERGVRTKRPAEHTSQSQSKLVCR